jgi:hypothetical protein
MIAIQKVKGKYGAGIQNPLFQVVNFNTKTPTGVEVIGFANARATANNLSIKAGNPNWIHIRCCQADKMYKTEEVA